MEGTPLTSNSTQKKTQYKDPVPKTEKSWWRDHFFIFFIRYFNCFSLRNPSWKIFSHPGWWIRLLEWLPTNRKKPCKSICYHPSLSSKRKTGAIISFFWINSRTLWILFPSSKEINISSSFGSCAFTFSNPGIFLDAWSTPSSPKIKYKDFFRGGFGNGFKFIETNNLKTIRFPNAWCTNRSNK